MTNDNKLTLVNDYDLSVMILETDILTAYNNELMQEIIESGGGQETKLIDKMKAFFAMLWEKIKSMVKYVDELLGRVFKKSEKTVKVKISTPEGFRTRVVRPSQLTPRQPSTTTASNVYMSTEELDKILKNSNAKVVASEAEANKEIQKLQSDYQELHHIVKLITVAVETIAYNISVSFKALKNLSDQVVADRFKHWNAIDNSISKLNNPLSPELAAGLSSALHEIRSVLSVEKEYAKFNTLIEKRLKDANGMSDLTQQARANRVISAARANAGHISKDVVIFTSMVHKCLNIGGSR